MRTTERGERSELKPPGIEFRSALAVEPEPADIGSPQRNAGHPDIQSEGDLLAQGSEIHVDVPGPQPRSVALRTRKRRATQNENALIRRVLLLPFEQGFFHDHRGDIVYGAGRPAIMDHVLEML